MAAPEAQKTGESGQVNFVTYLLSGQPHFLAKTHNIQCNVDIFQWWASESAIQASTIFVYLARSEGVQNS